MFFRSGVSSAALAFKIAWWKSCPFSAPANAFRAHSAGNGNVRPRHLGRFTEGPLFQTHTRMRMSGLCRVVRKAHSGRERRGDGKEWNGGWEGTSRNAGILYEWTRTRGAEQWVLCVCWVGGHFLFRFGRVIVRILCRLLSNVSYFIQRSFTTVHSYP